MKNYIPMCMAIVDALLAFESSGPKEIDPETAVRAVESMSSSLQQLDMEDQRELRQMLNDVAESADDISYREFVRAVPDMLSLAT